MLFVLKQKTSRRQKGYKMKRISKKPTFYTYYMDLGGLLEALSTNYFHGKHVCSFSLGGGVNFPWGQITIMTIRLNSKGLNYKQEWVDGYIDYVIPGPAVAMNDVYKDFCKKFDAGDFK